MPLNTLPAELAMASRHPPSAPRNRPAMPLASPPKEPAVLPLIVPAAAPALIVRLGVPLAKETEEPAAIPGIVARDAVLGRRARARQEAALRLTAQRNHKLGAIVGLAV